MGALIIYSTGAAEDAARLIREQRDPVVLEFDLELPDELKRRDVSVCSATDFLKLKEYDAIDDFIFHFLTEWSVRSGRDYSQWEGLSLAEAVSGFDMVRFWANLLKNLICAGKVIEKIGPAEIYLGRGIALLPRVWEALGSAKGIPLHRMKTDPPLAIDESYGPDAQSRSMKFGYRQPVTARCMNWLQGKTSGLKRRLPPEKSSDARMRLLCLWESKRAGKMLQKIGLSDLAGRPGFTLLDLSHGEVSASRERVFASAQNRAKDHFAGLWPRFRDEFRQEPPEFNGVSLRGFASEWIEDVYLRQLPQAAARLSVALEALPRLKPDALLTRLDWGVPSVCWCQAAERLGVPVVGVVREYFSNRDSPTLTRAVAGGAIAPGPSTVVFLQKRGIDRRFCLEAGEPTRRDLAERVACHDPARVKKAFGLDGRPVLLYPDIRYAGTWSDELPLHFRRQLKLIKQAARRLPRVQVVVKFHPGTQHREGVDHLQRRMNLLLPDKPDNLRILDLNLKPEPWLAVADLVACDRSTMGLEAMMLGKPVIYLRKPEDGLRVPLEMDGDPIALPGADEDSLVSAVNEFLKAPELMREKLKPGVEKFLNLLFAPPGDSVEVLERLLRLLGANGSN